ncbi:MAG: DUF1365 family protein [Jatrophihabitans sp.]|nr:MAG: DUF1365 family protein [Jatrophihabitans sp.]
MRRGVPRLGVPRGRLRLGRARGRIAGGVLVKPCRYRVEIGHTRVEPVRHEVRTRSLLWFVDLDELPRPTRLASFEARDHLGDPARSLRANVEDFLASRGVEPAGGRITMLCHARSLGYVFNPLTLYWCHDHGGAVDCVVAEVHNTYGGRHCYLLRPDDAGRAETAKQFYVSPFYPVDGFYRMSVPEPGERLAVTITLHRPGARPFTASMRGVRVPATSRAVRAAALRHPLASYAVRARITRHGIALWRKGIPIQPRPPQPDTEGRASVADRLESLVRSLTGRDLPVRIRAWDGSEAGALGGPVLVVRNRRALRHLLWAPGELGLARAYVSGDLDVEGNLADGLRQAWEAVRRSPRSIAPIGARGRVSAIATALRLGALGPPPAAPACEARLRGPVHSRGRDRAAIAHHYDLSNDFYALLLDETMAYSSAVFTTPGQPLAEAQRAKLEAICSRLDLRPGMRLLDVGCGWGSLILHAAEHHGVHAVGVTLSAQQRDHVAKQVAERGLADRVEVRLQDYREIAASGERFDAVASIEMGEHVGEGNYPRYAAALFTALVPGGSLVLQQMSRKGDAAPGGGAFIERYIAPDMHMRPLPQTLAHLERAGFEIRQVQALREHYVTTVRHWIDTLEARWPDFVALAGEQTARVWRLYLAGGALSFEQGRMGVDQILARRPGPTG